MDVPDIFLFKNISFSSVAGLDTYMTNVSAFHSKVYDPDFIDNLKRDVASRNMELIHAASTVKPNQAITQGDVEIVGHEDGNSVVFRHQQTKG